MTTGRRAFLGHAAALAAVTALSSCSSAAPAVQAAPSPRPRLPRIGFLLTNPVADAVAVDHLNAFREGLRELGYKDGETIAIEVRSAEAHPERFPELAAEMVGSRPELNLTAQPQAAVALKNATSVIPIVFIGIAPSVVGITDLGRPGGNLTGLSASSPGPFASKRLQLLKDVVPRVSRVAVLYNPDPDANVMSDIVRAAPGLGIQVHPHEVRISADFEARTRSR